FDVVGPAVLVIEIIGVFPNVEAEKRCISVHERTVLVRGGYDFELSTFVLNQHAQPLPKRPTPAAANFSLNASKLPNADLISSASLPLGSPPAFGPRIFQKKE